MIARPKLVRDPTGNIPSAAYHVNIDILDKSLLTHTYWTKSQLYHKVQIAKQESKLHGAVELIYQ